MTSEQIHQDLVEIVRELMKKEGVSRYKLNIVGQSEAGDNYLGEIVFFEILSENGEKIHEMVMKTAKRSEDLRKSVPIELVYNRELFLYSKVFPEFRKFLKEINADFEFDFVPEVHWISADREKETLIFDNLKSKGFKLRDRKTPWNLEHSLFIMEHYGKYHAISLALKDQKPNIFEKLTENLESMGEKFCENMNVNTMYDEPLKNVMNLLKKIGREDLVKKYNGLLEEVIPIALGKSDETDKIVITHGDCWNNNFMFKYKNEDETKPWKVCFLDFQISCIDSPILDLSYNIFASCDKTCLDHLDLILETYYNSLSKTIKKLGSNPEILFSYDEFRKHWKKYSKYGVLISTLILKILLTTKEDAPDIVKNSEEGKSIEECFNIVVKNEDEYNRRVLDVFTIYGDKFL